jgi:hypothetical protein
MIAGSKALASDVIWLIASLRAAQGDGASFLILPTVEKTMLLTKERILESWNADFDPRTSEMCGIVCCASFIGAIS